MIDRRTVIVGGVATVAIGGGIAASLSGTGSLADYNQAMREQRARLGGGTRELVRFAMLAANSHNTQPWRFRISDRAIAIVPDFERRTPAVDPDDHHLYVSLGCATENLALAAHARGHSGEPHFDASGAGRVLYEHTAASERPSVLCEAITCRQSTRALFEGRTVATADLSLLERVSAEPGVDLTLITDRGLIDRVRDLVIAGNDLQMADEAFMAELKAWMRFNPRAALAHGDGLFSGSSGNPSLPEWLGRPLFDLAFRPQTENDKYARHIASSAGLAIFAGARSAPASWFAVGRACQRFALQATALGMKVAFINQPAEVASLRPELASLLGMPGRRCDIVMRFGYGPLLPMSPRRPVSAVVEALS